MTVKFGGSTVIFATTKCPEAAWEFYKFHNNPEYVDLFEAGLWMPLQKDYYTDATKTEAWLEGEPGIYPPEAKEVFVDYTLHHTSVQLPNYLYKNTTQIFNEALNPAMELLFSGKATAQAAMAEAARQAAPLMQGRW